MKPFTIRTYFPTGDPSGLRKAFVRGLPIQAFYIPRDSVNIFKNHYAHDASLEGVYLLFDTTNSKKVTYVGKTTNILKRIETYSTSNDKEQWWNVEIVFTIDNASDPLQAGDISYLEYLMCKKAQQGSYDLTYNSQHPHKPQVSEDEEAYLNDLFVDIDRLTQSFGFNVFNNIVKPKINKQRVFQITRRNSNAQAEYSSQGMLILKNSQCTSLDFNKKAPRKKFDHLVKQGIIQNNVFQKNYLATSPSTASSLILKAPSDGWTEWYQIDKKGNKKSLDEVYR